MPKYNFAFLPKFQKDYKEAKIYLLRMYAKSEIAELDLKSKIEIAEIISIQISYPKLENYIQTEYKCNNDFSSRATNATNDYL
ncbi:MAG: hypothetical protein RL154_1560 [Pseudomonadota bacterium]|jgi:hypothetical protein